MREGILKAEERKRVILWDEYPDATELSEFKEFELVTESNKIVDQRNGGIETKIQVILPINMQNNFTVNELL